MMAKKTPNVRNRRIPFPPRFTLQTVSICQSRRSSTDADRIDTLTNRARSSDRPLGFRRTWALLLVLETGLSKLQPQKNLDLTRCFAQWLHQWECVVGL